MLSIFVLYCQYTMLMVKSANTWITYPAMPSIQYMYATSCGTWTDAVSYCESIGGELASAQSEEQRNFIVNTVYDGLSGSGGCSSWGGSYLGGEIINSQNQINWFDGSITPFYDAQNPINWDTNADEPDHLSTHIVIGFELSSKQWHTVWPGDRNVQFCQKIITSKPTALPSSNPTNQPTDDPTIDPTNDPTIDPTDDPTTDPTDDPTNDPTNNPTTDPTDNPTLDPTDHPTNDPTSDPTVDPTIDPTRMPTGCPSNNPTSFPHILNATNIPSNSPTDRPSKHDKNDHGKTPTLIEGQVDEITTTDTIKLNQNEGKDSQSDGFLTGDILLYLIISISICTFIVCIIVIILRLGARKHIDIKKRSLIYDNKPKIINSVQMSQPHQMRPVPSNTMTNHDEGKEKNVMNDIETQQTVQHTLGITSSSFVIDGDSIDIDTFGIDVNITNNAFRPQTEIKTMADTPIYFEGNDVNKPLPISPVQLEQCGQTGNDDESEDEDDTANTSNTSLYEGVARPPTLGNDALLNLNDDGNSDADDGMYVGSEPYIGGYTAGGM